MVAALKVEDADQPVQLQTGGHPVIDSQQFYKRHEHNCDYCISSAIRQSFFLPK